MRSWVLQRGNPDVDAPAIQAHRPSARIPLALLALVAPILVLTLIFCRAGRLNWLLELGPALIAYAVLAATYRRFPLSNLCYVLVFLHTLVPARPDPRSIDGPPGPVVRDVYEDTLTLREACERRSLAPGIEPRRDRTARSLTPAGRSARV